MDLLSGNGRGHKLRMIKVYLLNWSGYFYFSLTSEAVKSYDLKPNETSVLTSEEYTIK